MSNWIPTNELRFVERKFLVEEMNTSVELTVLQQRWIGKDVDSTGYEYDIEEWRDVPVVEEE